MSHDTLGRFSVAFGRSCTIVARQCCISSGVLAINTECDQRESQGELCSQEAPFSYANIKYRIGSSRNKCLSCRLMAVSVTRTCSESQKAFQVLSYLGFVF